MSEFNEPWVRNLTSIYGGEGQLIARISDHGPGSMGGGMYPADAARIVACVNALAGIPTEDLRKCDGGLLELASLIAERFDMVLADPT